MASLIAFPSAGSASRTYSVSRFVTKPVRTTAPFSYVILASQTMWSTSMHLLLLMHVRDGANRKNLMPRLR